jgi:hypothetical protein
VQGPKFNLPHTPVPERERERERKRERGKEAKRKGEREKTDSIFREIQAPCSRFKVQFRK